MTGELESVIGYSFKDKSLLKEALTHSSCVRAGSSTKDNERLEFLGDAFLDAIAGEEIYKRLPDATEGKLTKVRAQVVRGKTLSLIGRKLSLGSYLDMSRGQEQQGGRNMDSILADALEAVIGAVFLDGGYEKAREVTLDLISEYIAGAIKGELTPDYKSRLQEILQKRGMPAPEYEVVSERGPSHDKIFFVEVSSCGKKIGAGSGRSKKEAEQMAAQKGIERIR